MTRRDAPIRKHNGWTAERVAERYEVRGGGARVPAGSVWCRSCGNVPVPPHRGVCRRCAARNAKKRKQNKRLTQRLEKRNPPWAQQPELPL